MANRKMTYADLLKDKGTYAVKARREKHLAKFARHRAALAEAVVELDKAEKADLEAFEATINGVNAAAVAAIPLLPKKPKAEVKDADPTLPAAMDDGAVDATGTDAPAPDGTEGIEIVDLETDTDALVAIAAEPFAEPLPVVELEIPASHEVLGLGND